MAHELFLLEARMAGVGTRRAPVRGQLAVRHGTFRPASRRPFQAPGSARQ